VANLAQLKARVAQLANKGSKGAGNKPNLRWSPSDEHDVRLIPFGKNPLNDSILEMMFHYQLGETRSLLCPESTDLVLDETGVHKCGPGVTFEKKCLVNTYSDELWSKYDSDTKELKSREQKDADYQVHKKIRPQTRFAALIVERGKEADGAKWWCLSKNALEQIIKICESGPNRKLCGIKKDDTEAGYAVLVDTQNAFDLHISVKKARNEDGKGNDKDYNEIVISVQADEPTSLGKDAKETKALLASIKPFTEAYPLKSSEDIEKILESFMKSEFTPESKKDEQMSSNGTEKYGVNSTENVESVGDRLAAEAVEDLMNA
jgi:hypothetical protein